MSTEEEQYTQESLRLDTTFMKICSDTSVGVYLQGSLIGSFQKPPHCNCTSLQDCSAATSSTFSLSNVSYNYGGLNSIRLDPGNNNTLCVSRVGITLTVHRKSATVL